MHDNQYTEGRRKEIIIIQFSYVKGYDIIWKNVINLKMHIINLRVNTSFPSAKERHKKSKVEIKMKYQKYSMHQKYTVKVEIVNKRDRKIKMSS